MGSHSVLTFPFDRIGRDDIARVGGKNASLGEMRQRLSAAGVRVPDGFALAAGAYRRFIAENALEPAIARELEALAHDADSLPRVGGNIRSAILAGRWPEEVEAAIVAAYAALCRASGAQAVHVAVRSSATAEDLPHASFAGQHDTFLNISGAEAVLDACKRCYASLFTDRAIVYRQAQGFDHLRIALSVGVQRMVRADLGGAGVLFSIDTETGFPNVAFINSTWGLGDLVVQGEVDPDEHIVFKPLLDVTGVVPIIEKRLGAKSQKMVYAAEGDEPTCKVPTPYEEQGRFVLSDAEVLILAKWACLIERHYGSAMDIEWAKDGESGDLFVLQARPETVHSRKRAAAFQTYHIKWKGPELTRGLAIGGAVATGKACLVRSPDEIDRFQDGAVLVAETTDPDWVPIMKRAAAIVTDHGGRTSHAAIVSRELGVPAIVGTGNATNVLRDAQEITVSCCEGLDGFVYGGRSEYEIEEFDLASTPKTQTQIMLNLANPAAAFRWWRLPTDGVGLARMEFVVSNHVKIHPMALVQYDALTDVAARDSIRKLTEGYADKSEYFVDRLSRGLSRIAAALHPKPVIVRLSDFKTNEYAALLGGSAFEPLEANPMLGLRGASRYYSDRYREGFALECRAIKRLREEMGFANVIVMIPFCRSVREADRVLRVMAENGLRRGENGLQIYVMCEIPSNVILAKDFAERFDGFSIGSNDLTQLVLGVDRDCEELAELFDEQDEAVKWMISEVITAAHLAEAKIGLCGQAPSDYPDFAEFLVECGIDSISVSPDSFMAVKRKVAQAEEARAARLQVAE
jgi:pyruvate,water dikinase